jgi:acyl-coenzyme A synthetase/AMP-(fatty) acid ligase
MDVLGDLVDRARRDRRGAATALTAPAVDRSYSWHDLCTDAYKAGNVLRFLGVRGESGAGLAVAADPLPEPVLAFLGAAQLGATTRFVPAGSAGAVATATGNVRVLLLPVDREDETGDLPPDTKLAVHGGRPGRPSTTHWERELWSENPQVHPAQVAPDDAALVAHGDGDETTYSHGALLSAAGAVVDDLGLTEADAVAVRGSLTHPGVVVAGVVAPLLAGGSVILGPDEPADAAVGDGPEPAARTVDPDDVLGCSGGLPDRL